MNPHRQRHESPETRPQEPESIQLKSSTSKKGRGFLIAAGIALVIVAGGALWIALSSPKPPEPEAVAAQVTTTPDVQPEPREVTKPAVKPPEPQVKTATEAPAKPHSQTASV